VRRGDGAIEGEVLTIDRFGNALTNLLARDVDSVTLDEGSARRRLRLVRTYADAMAGEAVALVGSSGFLEIALRDGDAARALGIRRGQRVTVTQTSR
jgi:S-adenosylmethionine hydrolase